MSDCVCLIVDDDPAIRHFFRTILEQRQLHSLESDDASHAFRIIQKLEGRLDLLVTEIDVPGDMNGVDLAHCVRIAFPAIPVILFSNHCDKDVRKPAGFEFIAKPFLQDRILKAVAKAVN